MLEIPPTASVMGALIGKTLIDKGISQAEFCRRVGVSAKHLNRVVLGHNVATQAQLDYWAFVLGMTWSVRLVKRRSESGSTLKGGQADG
jgi:transcriptional regulator with XRE-family HTH domain